MYNRKNNFLLIKINIKFEIKASITLIGRYNMFRDLNSDISLHCFVYLSIINSCG